MEAKTNMYASSVCQWCPFVGCCYRSIYCKPTFQAQLKRRGKKRAPKCYNFEPHEHSERLNRKLPKTRYMQFIFTCASGDVSFCRTEFMMKVADRIKSEREKNFLIQSKNPKTFNRFQFTSNVILGKTLETNRDERYQEISRAPKPSQRYRDFLEVNHPVKMVTIEPVMDFDLHVMTNWIENINPCMVWMGYDSRKNYLPEPELEKVKSLYWYLGSRGFTVVLKKIRKAWWEK